jgi:organic radical activating enzyme
MEFKPYLINIEFVRGCNLRCGFCGVHSMPKDFKYINIVTLMKIIKEIKVWDGCRISINVRGEPTLHKDWINMIKLIRDEMPKSTIGIISNGNKITVKDIKRFFKSGGNVFLMDCYNNSYNQRKEAFKELKPIDYYNSDFKYYQKQNPDKTHVLILCDDISEHNSDRKDRTLFNWAGNIPENAYKKYGIKKLKSPLKKKCTRPFRELTLFYDGTVAICCYDWQNRTKLWNINKKMLKRFWEDNPMMHSIRGLLYNKDRDFGICKDCDYDGGAYMGFLPKYPELSLKTRNKIREDLEC